MLVFRNGKRCRGDRSQLGRGSLLQGGPTIMGQRSQNLDSGVRGSVPKRGTPFVRRAEYTATLEALFAKRSRRRKSIESLRHMCAALGHPEKDFPSVHIAGTNGKGTAATRIAKGLEASSHRVGLFTSPHITSFRERISINGVFISEEDVVAGLAYIEAVAAQLEIDLFFFDSATLLAFIYFCNSGVDIAVIETGVGGAIDSTNVITPLLSIITSVDFDHASLLGPTLNDIARQKAGIIKKKVPVVLGPDLNMEPIHTLAKAMEAPLYCADSHLDIVRCALTLLRESFQLTDEAIEEGLAARPPCRLQEVRGSSGEVESIVDVAHNPSGLRYLFAAIERRPIHLVFGLARDKQLAEAVDVVAQHVEHVSLIDIGVPRLFRTDEIEKAFQEVGYRSVAIEALEEARERAVASGALLVVTGSFYLVGAVAHERGISPKSVSSSSSVGYPLAVRSTSPAKPMTARVSGRAADL